MKRTFFHLALTAATLLIRCELCPAQDGFGFSPLTWGGAASYNPQYTNPGGIGDRRSANAVIYTDGGGGLLAQAPSSVGSNLVDGVTSQATSWFNSTTASNKWLRFDFGTRKLVTEAKWYQSSTATHGTWQWQGSADATNWTSIGSTFTFGGAATNTLTTLSGNATGYRYYRILGVSGNASSGPYTSEMEFKLDNWP